MGLFSKNRQRSSSTIAPPAEITPSFIALDLSRGLLSAAHSPELASALEMCGRTVDSQAQWEWVAMHLHAIARGMAASALPEEFKGQLLPMLVDAVVEQGFGSLEHRAWFRRLFDERCQEYDAAFAPDASPARSGQLLAQK